MVSTGLDQGSTEEVRGGNLHAGRCVFDRTSDTHSCDSDHFDCYLLRMPEITQEGFRGLPEK